MKMVGFLLIAVLLIVAGCSGTFNGLGRDLEGTGQFMREVSQPGVDKQTRRRVSGAYREWEEGNGPVARR